MADFAIAFVIEFHQRPLLLVEIKTPWDFRLDSGRDGAVIQVIQHLDEIGPTYQHLDRLYAISALGENVESMLRLESVGTQTLPRTLTMLFSPLFRQSRVTLTGSQSLYRV